MAASLKIQGLAKRHPFIKVFRCRVCARRFSTGYPTNRQSNTMGFQMDSHVVLIYRAVAGWWAVSEQETPETTLASVNLNHISVLRSQFSQKLNWKEGERKKKCTFLPRMLSFRCCKDTKLVLHKADRVSCLFPLKRERGKMENGFFSNIQAVICVRPAKLLFYRSPWQLLSRWSLAQPVWISPALLWSPWNLDEQNSLRQRVERGPLVPENPWCTQNMFFSAQEEGKQEVNMVMRMIKNNV